MSVFNSVTEKLEYDYKCEVGIHHALSPDEYKNFVEWLAVRASAYNNDYAKCLEALKAIRFSGNNFDETAIKMQKWAAWGMEPEKWLKPE